MAGDFESNSFKRCGRRKWTVIRGDLFHQEDTGMAEDGCPDAQFQLGNKLLKNCDSPHDEVENAREGIYWLVKASEQGHEEATNLLRYCLENSKGITEHNICEVIDCLETTTNVKLSVKAMRHLFLNCSDGEEFITCNQLLKQLKEVEHGVKKTGKLPQIEERKHECENWKSRENIYGQKLTEDVLVSAARTYARGELPDIGQCLVLPEQDICNFTSVRSLYKVFFFPILLNKLYFYLLSFNPQLITSTLYVSSAHLKMFFLLFLFNSMDSETIFSSLPVILYYLSFATMVGTTCEMLKYRQRFRNFRCWSNLFLLYGGKSFSPQEAEFLHCRNGFPAYAKYFACLLVNLFIQSFAPVRSIFQAEITFIAFLFTILTLVAFTFSNPWYMTSETEINYLGLFSFMLHVLAKYPYETDSVVGIGWRFLDLQVPTFASYVIGHGIEFCLNFRAFFYLLIPAVLVKMAARHNWRGVYSDLIPHCVTLAWWQLTLIYAEGITWYSLIRPALALVGILFFLPLTVLASVFLPVYAIAKYFLEYEDICTIMIACAFAVGLPLLLLKATSTNAYLRTINTYDLFQIVFIVVAVVFLVSQSNLNFPSNFKHITRERRPIEVNEFSSYCGSFDTSYTYVGEIEKQLLCSEVVGLPVYWKGKVKKTKISKIHNPVLNVINKLPKFLSSSIHYLLGDEYSLCKSSFKVSFCKSLSESHQLTSWNSYEFEIEVGVYADTGGILPVTLIANDNFYNITRKLNSDDDVWFAGTIISDENGLVNSVSPRIQLSSITCVSCLDSELTETTNITRFSSTYCYNFAKYLLNFVLNPLIVFK